GGRAGGGGLGWGGWGGGGLALGRFLRSLRERSAGARAMADGLAALPPAAWVRTRFPRQAAWLGRRLDPSSPKGFALTFWVSAGALAAWAFGGLTQDVVGHDEVALLDPRVE